jgi:ABC-type molybdenum transport system ATPase subunit/photorepair protein PhrA
MVEPDLLYLDEPTTGMHALGMPEARARQREVTLSPDLPYIGA